MTHDEHELAAGEFSSWLTEIEGAIRGDHGSTVPCNGCTACCTSAQFIHIGPDERDTLSHIPAELLFPAPRLPRGHVVLGYDERGHCPMLIDDRCSIYEHRPRTCRTYDCRVFPAAGLEPDEHERSRSPDRPGDGGSAIRRRMTEFDTMLCEPQQRSSVSTPACWPTTPRRVRPNWPLRPSRFTKHFSGSTPRQVTWCSSIPVPTMCVSS